MMAAEARRAGADRRFAACIFDLFGTLVPLSRRSDYYAALAVVPERLGLDAGAFREGWDASYRERNEGRLATLEDNVLEVCRRLGASSPPAAVTASLIPFRRLLDETLQPKPESAAVLDEISRRRFALGLISNCNPDVPALFRRGALASRFHAALFSSEAGVAKPRPEIYVEMARLLGVAPGDCLYIGDGHGRELAGAAAVGMTTALLDHGQPDGYIFDRDETGDFLLASLTDVLGIAGESTGTACPAARRQGGSAPAGGPTPPARCDGPPPLPDA